MPAAREIMIGTPSLDIHYQHLQASPPSLPLRNPEGVRGGLSAKAPSEIFFGRRMGWPCTRELAANLPPVLCRAPNPLMARYEPAVFFRPAKCEPRSSFAIWRRCFGNEKA